MSIQRSSTGSYISCGRMLALTAALVTMLAGGGMARADTRTFQQGVNGYAGTVDTYIHAGAPTADNSAAILLTADGPDPATDVRQILIRFDNIFGSSAGLIPLGSTINSATLTVNVSNAYLLVDYVRFHRMMQTWSATNTWNTFGVSPWNTTAGIQADDVEAVAAADVTVNNIPAGLQSIAVTTSLQAWAAAPASNFGWVLRVAVADSLAFDSSEVTTAANRPKLTVDFTRPPCQTNADCNDNIACTTDTCNTGTGVCSNVDNCPIGSTCDHATGGCSTIFQDGSGSYASTQDAHIQENAPTTNYGSAATVKWDTDEPANSSKYSYGLFRFDNIFGSGAGQIPSGSTINSATLTLYITNITADAETAATINEVAVDWTEATVTWNSFGNAAGVQAEDYGVSLGSVPRGPINTAVNIDVKSSIQAWVSNPAANRGWIIRPASTDGEECASSEGTTQSQRPMLTVTYIPPITGCTTDAQCSDGLWCNGVETCNQDTHTCQSGTAPNCDDGVACTTDSCDEVNDQCVHTANNSACNDSNPCTDDTCVPGTGCVHTNNTASCDDGNACTTNDTCSNGSCVGGAAPNCDDGIACTTDGCNPSTGCTHVDNCTGGQVCNHSTGLCETPSVPTLPVNIGATWKYRKGTSEPPAAWKTISFDDSGSDWLSGASGFGYGAAGSDCDTQRATTLDMSTYLSLYLRKQFYVANPAAISAITLTIYYDDAFVAYLNGQEVARSTSMGGTVGVPPAYNTAGGDHECTNSPSPETFTLSVSTLVTGVNVLAIQGHNSSTTSSDFIIAPKFEAVAPPDPAPIAPTNPSPSSGGIGVALSPQLCADVSDGVGDNDALTVTFYGREVTSTPGDPFAIVVLPDPQNYAQSYASIYSAQTQWCVTNRVSRNIVFVTCVGDMTNDASSTQWTVVDAAFSLLENPGTTGLTDGIPYGLAVGNHDQNPSGSARSGTDEGATTIQYNTTFGRARFVGRSYFGDNYTFGGAYPNSMDNHYELFTASGMDFIVFHLECDGMGSGYEGTCSSATCTAIIQWVHDLLHDTYPNRRAIVVSHALMQASGAAFMAHGQAIYNGLKDLPNFFMMLTGHLDQANHRVDLADDSHPIYTLIQDYQMQSNGGNGWLRILTFNPQADTIHVETYSPTVGAFINKPTAHSNNSPNDACARDCYVETGGTYAAGGNELLLPYDMEAGAPFVQIGQLTGMASGSRACMSWPGRALNKQYEWYVTVSDGTSTTTGLRWTFATTSSCTDNAQCDDGNPCTDDTCNQGTGLCEYTNNTASCTDDGNPCTDDVCSGGSCTHPADNSHTCSDGNACTTDACVNGSCVSTYAPTPGCCATDADCNDGNAGTTDTCNLSTHTCSNVQNQSCTSTAQCDDGNVCTTDVCAGADVAAVELNGSTQYISLGNDNNNANTNFLTNFDTNSFTIEGWFWADTANATYITLFRQGSQNAYPQVVVQTATSSPYNRLAASVETSTSPSQVDTGTPPTFSLNAWHHFALVVARDIVTPANQRMNLYLDGALAESTVATAWGSYPINDTISGSTRDPVWLGAVRAAPGGSPTAYFDGRFDEIRIWNYARSAQEILDNKDKEITSATGLVHRWAMNEGTGTAIADTGSSPAAGGQLVNGATWLTSGLPTLGPGICEHTPITNCCISDSQCDDGLYCNGVETCNQTTHTCQAGTAPDCNDNNVCTTDSCNESTDSCDHITNTAACDDGNACTTNDTCSNGTCVGGPAPNCDDGIACTTDACNPASGCTHTDNCTGGQTCNHTAGLCETTCTSDAQCDDSNACTTDHCNLPNTSALNFDGVDDHVTMGQALGLSTATFTLEAWIRRDGASWGNANATTGTDGLQNVVAVIAKGRSEGDGSNIDCNYFFGLDANGRLAADFEQYQSTPWSAGENHPMCSSVLITDQDWHHVAVTYDKATGKGWRIYLDGANVTAADGTSATCGSVSTCGNAALCPQNPGVDPRYDSIQHFALGVALNSAGQNPGGYFGGMMDEARVWNYARSQAEIQAAMYQQITSATGLIGRWSLNEGTGTAANDSTSPAENGTLTYGPVWITSDLPNLGTGTCQHTAITGCCNIDADCDNGLFCDGVETCDVATHTCKAGTSPCDDQIACTTDSCDENADACTHTPNNTICNDGNPCTDDVCDPVYGDPVTGCVHTNNTAACDDGNACTTDDVCSGGACVGGPALNCDDGNPCTDDTCNPATGCVRTNNTATCDDGLWCSVGDHCAGGSCVGTARDCSDGIACTTDTCNETTDQCDHVLMTGYCEINNACYANGAPNPVNSCLVCNTSLSTSAWSLAPNGTACNDGNACTTGETCQAGVCVGGPTCDDGNACTTDTCASAVSQYALDFVPNGYVDVGSGATINTHGLNSFTVEAWVWVDAISADRVGIFRQGRQGSYPQVALQLMSNKTFAASVEAYTSPYVDAQVDVQSSSSSPINYGQWYHVAMVIDRTSGAQALRLFVNGALAGQDTTLPNTKWAANPINIIPNENSVIGAARGSDGVLTLFHDGRIDEVRMWNHARTAQQIADNMNRRITSGNGLLARWGFDEGTGTLAPDSSGNGNNGTLTNMGTSPWVAGATALPASTCSYSNVQGCCNTAAECNDGNICTTDTCQNNVCVHTNNTLPCDDGNSCTTNDTCSGGACVGTPIANCCRNDADCNDGAACTTDTCNTANVAAIGLNGSTQYVNVGNDGGNTSVNCLTNFGMGNFTIEGWIYADYTSAPAASTGVFRHGRQGVNPQVVVQFQTGGVLAASVDSGNDGAGNQTQADANATSAFPLRAWHHFAMVVNRTNPSNQLLILYQDGVPVATASGNTWSTRAISSTDPVWFGVARDSSGALLAGSYFSGRLDEIRIWDQVRSTDQIVANMNKQILSDPHLRHRWAMNEGSGTTTADTGSTPTTAATLVNSPTWRTLAADIPTFGNDRCTHTLNTGVCLIDSACYADGTTNPNNLCQVCNSTSNPNGWTNKGNGVTCTDGNACTQTDTCQGGVCVGSNPVVCSALDQCHDVGTCDTGTGLCSNPAKTNGTPCNDSDLCTQTDTCVDGTCVGANPVVCSALDQCHDVGTCDTGTGLCSNPAKTNGTPCNDSDLCTQTDTCVDGTCVGANPVVCSALDQCHDVGTCDTGTGLCSNPAKADSTPCNDGDACTQTDTCQSGVCVGANPVVCSALDQCHDVGTCDTGTGLCSNPAKTNGTPCNDSDLCTQTDTCVDGTCVGANPVVCTALDQCHDVGTCDTGTGLCSNPAKADNTPCSDSDLCTQTDTCQSGVCTGSNPVVCTAQDQCHDVGTCEPGTGQCSNPAKPNGTSCDDGDACTANDVCTGGSCAGVPKNCDDGNACTADSCVNGDCQHIAVTNGTACNDSDLCTQTDTCQSGVCTGSNPVVCTAQDQCHDVGTCEPGTGQCSNPAKPNGTSCDDGDACTSGSTCNGGICGGGVAVSCDDGDPCTVDSCDSVDGCSHMLLQGVLHVAIEVQGLTNDVTRPVTFVICGASGETTQLSVPVQFVAATSGPPRGLGQVTLNGIDPEAAYMKATEGHTLSQVLPFSFGADCEATVAFTGANQLLAGDFRTASVPQNNFVDIQDFAILAINWNVPIDANSGWLADATGDGLQGLGDFTAIQANFATVGQTMLCPRQAWSEGGGDAWGASTARIRGCRRCRHIRDQRASARDSRSRGRRPQRRRYD